MLGFVAFVNYLSVYFVLHVMQVCKMPFSDAIPPNLGNFATDIAYGSFSCTVVILSSIISQKDLLIKDKYKRPSKIKAHFPTNPSYMSISCPK